MKKIAFYAPIKPPDHPIASGDRLIGANLISALELAGFGVEIASRFIAYSKRADGDILLQRKTQALQQAKKIVQAMQNDPPNLWLSYHPYCKAPDWLGPYIAKHFSIPYVTVEACRTWQGTQNGKDLWHDWRLQAQENIATAQKHFYFKPNDADYLQTFVKNKNLCFLPPFIDVASRHCLLKSNVAKNNKGVCLITVAQMRAGKKVKNYEILANSLQSLQKLDWNLIIVGDGPERKTIKNLFSSIDESRLHWAAALLPQQVLHALSKADIFVWPGWNEPIGMVYLEAQMMGLPIVAQKSGGVPLVVENNKTGLLVNDSWLLSKALASLICDIDLRKKLGAQGIKKVQANHSLEVAAGILGKELKKLI